MHLDKQIFKKVEEYNPKGNLGHTVRVVYNLFDAAGLTKVKKHMQRVALLSEEAAKKLKMDSKAAFFGGGLHDDGKLCEDPELFDGHGINGAEYVRVKRHSIKGFKALSKLHLFTAMCAGFHHGVYRGGYGLTVKDFPKEWSIETIAKFLNIVTIISIADFIDAFTHRKTKIKDGSDNKSKSLRSMLRDKYPNNHLMVNAVLNAHKKLGL